MRRALSALACGLALAAAPAHGQSTSLPGALTSKIEALIGAEMAAGNLPGVAVGIWMPGRGDYVVAKGAANLETGSARQTGHPFRIGSVTKPAIATAVLQLAEEGALAVSDPIQAWFPGFPNGETITVDDLLRMRSGIVDSWTDSQLEAYYADPTAPLTAEDMIARAAQLSEQFKTPDGETVYTNLNYILLDKIIAAVTGEPTPAVLESRIFAPLGMTASELATGTELPGPLRGYGWNAQNGEYEDKTELNPEPVGGAGAMISSLEDLHAFVRALCTGALLSPEGQATRLDGAPLKGAPDFLRYGQGIGSLGEFCGHNGTIMGFSTEAWYLPSQDAAVVISVNRLDVDDESMSSPLFFKLTKLLFPDEVEW